MPLSRWIKALNNRPHIPKCRQEAPVRMHFRQLTLQGAAAFAVLSVTWPYFGLKNEALPWPETAIAIGSIALLLATLSNQRWWWRIIHALFAPLAWTFSLLELNSNWFLLAFVLMLLVYRGAITSHVPLFLSNAKTVEKLSELTENFSDMRFIDLGAGLGSVVRGLALSRADIQLTGVENAPATWLVGRVRTLGLKNCAWRFGDIWKANLNGFDVVYSFLSPAPMAELWRKVQLEMAQGSLFISNSFPVPGVEADKIVAVDDARNTLLYCYQR